MRERSPYHRDLHEDRVWSALHGESCRARQFLERHDIQCPTVDELDCWSDLLDDPDHRPKPGYQLLHRWGRRAAACGQAAITGLFRAWLLCGGGLKHAAEQVSRLVDVPCSLRPLTLALLLWLALRPPGPLQTEFTLLLRYLLDPSPMKRREPGRAFAYDGRARASRASPDVAADKEVPF